MPRLNAELARDAIDSNPDVDAIISHLDMTRTDHSLASVRNAVNTAALSNEQLVQAIESVNGRPSLSAAAETAKIASFTGGPPDIVEALSKDLFKALKEGALAGVGSAMFNGTKDGLSWAWGGIKKVGGKAAEIAKKPVIYKRIVQAAVAGVILHGVTDFDMFQKKLTTPAGQEFVANEFYAATDAEVRLVPDANGTLQRRVRIAGQGEELGPNDTFNLVLTEKTAWMKSEVARWVDDVIIPEWWILRKIDPDKYKQGNVTVTFRAEQNGNPTGVSGNDLYVGADPNRPGEEMVQVRAEYTDPRENITYDFYLTGDVNLADLTETNPIRVKLVSSGAVPSGKVNPDHTGDADVRPQFERPEPVQPIQ